MDELPKIIVLLGPTASGKTDLGIILAKKFNGEIISADSRQVYRGMSVGTGKPNGVWQDGQRQGILRVVYPDPRVGAQDDGDVQDDNARKREYIVEGVPHYLMDIIEPDEDFTLSDFKKMAEEKIWDILKRGKMPIIVGGTGLYVWSIVDNLDMPAVAPDAALRVELEKKSLEEQVKLLEEKDPETAKKIDLKNPRRVLRALEVCLDSGKSFVEQRKQAPPLFNALQIGLNWPRTEIYERIEKRIDGQIKDGWVGETEDLVKAGFDWKLPSMSGIGHKQLGEYLRGEKTLEKAIEEIKQKTRNYAKRQVTWFKRDKRIKWIDKNNLDEAIELVKNFIK